jgi:hypothetical protein
MIIARNKKLAAFFTILSIIYLSLSVLVPPDKVTLARYHITRSQDAGLTFTITIPYLIIWFVALVGYSRLKSYSDKISRSKDGAAFQTISKGILWLSLWLPISAVMNTLFNSYYHYHPSATAWLVNVNNYLNIILLLTAFWFIYNGTKQLLGVIKKPSSQLPLALTVLFITFSAYYLFLVLQDPSRQFPTAHVAAATYYLPDWLTILLIVIPRLITWHLGMQAVYNLYLYCKNVKGPIYKRALNDLTAGLAWVVITIIILRCFESLASQLTSLSLGIILLLIYFLLALVAIGYSWIARGAKKLQRIEEI